MTDHDKGEPMFTKYEYTCPDVIHDHKIAKVRTGVAFSGIVALMAFYAFTAWREERKEAQTIKNLETEFTAD